MAAYIPANCRSSTQIRTLWSSCAPWTWIFVPAGGVIDREKGITRAAQLDIPPGTGRFSCTVSASIWSLIHWITPFTLPPSATRSIDRKSTRLNYSHVKISYAVFCLDRKSVV